MTRPTMYGEPIVTGEAVTVELRPAGIGSRGIALAVDVAVQLVASLLLLWFVAAVVSSVESAAGTTVVLVAFLGIWLGYPIALESMWHGRTLGKAAMGLRVLRDDGGPIRFRHAFVRGLVGLVVDRPGLSSGLLALVPMLVSSRSKRLGDLAAGTVVVQDRVPTRGATPPAMPPTLERWASSLDLTQITDQLTAEVRFFLARAGQLAPATRDQMGNRLVAEVSARTAPPPPGALLWEYLAAVLAERRRREVQRFGAAQPLPTPATQPAPPPAAPGPFAPPR